MVKQNLSEKELAFISKLELKNKYFFTREDISYNFKSKNERNVYIHRLRKKNRIIKLNSKKYYLIPIKAVKNYWSEHPFIMIDEIMNGKDYCIVGKAAAYYWNLIDQIPFEYEVFTPKKTGKTKIFNIGINFRKRSIKHFPETTESKVQGHKFIIATKKESERWI